MLGMFRGFIDEIPYTQPDIHTFIWRGFSFTWRLVTKLYYLVKNICKLRKPSKYMAFKPLETTMVNYHVLSLNILLKKQ